MKTNTMPQSLFLFAASVVLSLTLPQLGIAQAPYNGGGKTGGSQ